MTTMAEHDRTERLEAGNGNYWRDEAGVWRYAWGDEPVPGAVDRLEGGEVVGLDAPELERDQLVDSRTVARERGWRLPTLRIMVHRGRHCPPAVRFAGGHQPALYSRAAIDRFDAWRAARLAAAGLDPSGGRLRAARDEGGRFAAEDDD
jgi:hypothetical protein